VHPHLTPAPLPNTDIYPCTAPPPPPALTPPLVCQVANVSLIVGGHSHSFLFGSASNSSGPAFNASESPARAFDASLGPYPTIVNSTAQAGRKVPVLTAFFASRWVPNQARSAGQA
jgi:hypothetical protein